MSVGQVMGLKLSRIAVSQNCSDLVFETEWTTIGLFSEFCFEKCLMSSTSNLSGLKFARIVQILFFLTTSNLFDS